MFVRNRRWIIVSLCVAVCCIGLWRINVQGGEPMKPKKKQTHLRFTSPAIQSTRKYEFSLRIIKRQQDFYHLNEPVPLTPKSVLDSEGIPMYRKEQKLYNHPVRLAHNAINFITSYQLTDDRRYLDEAEKYVQRLAKIAVEQDGAMIFFPYDFDVYLHNIPTEHMKPRWYSGMAQGQALSAFVRLYQITHDPNLLTLADKTYLSLTQLKSSDLPIWVSMLDEQGYFWIEEYPMDEPTHVLNGFIFAIFGLYDYYQITKKEEVKELLQASITTVYDHIDRYRVPDGASRYGLKHPHQSKHYHHVHMDQLETLYHMTGESYFREVRQQFHHDWYGLPAKIYRQVDKVREWAS